LLYYTGFYITASDDDTEVGAKHVFVKNKKPLSCEVFFDFDA